MKLIYATSISYPSSLANRIQILAMAREFRAVLGGNFILGGRDIRGLDAAAYGEPANFHCTRSFILAWKYLAFMRREQASGNAVTHVYSREHKLVACMQFYNAAFFHLDLKFFYEAHEMPAAGRTLLMKTLNRCAGVVTITHGLKEALAAAGIGGQKITVAPDGIDLSMFDGAPDRTAARAHLDLPAEARIVLYTGHLYAWKGTDTLAAAGAILGDAIGASAPLVVFVGGKEKDIEAFKARHASIANIRIIGPKPHEEIPMWFKAVDVLVLPNSATEDISRLYTSPLKMFEYMASGRPIVASDLPSIREVLNEGNATFFTADDPASLAEAIRKCLADPALARAKAAQALKDVQGYSWQKRALAILSFMNIHD